MARLLKVTSLQAFGAAFATASLISCFKLFATLNPSSFLAEASIWERTAIALDIAAQEIALSTLKYLLLYFTLGMIIGLATMVVADQHLNRQCWKSVLCASACAPVFVLMALVGQFGIAMGEAEINSFFVESLLTNGVFQGIFSLAFLALFAFLVELSEGSGNDDFSEELD
ncbi:hypothetical protein [Shimia sp. R9_3]|uniref:hypothetical protein n=1 Tax=Shimia sp. R9_3 TaxID=2821113 RepID=UPI001ADA51E8|nr:hypothetical protein [Shimia sp. R9_3]MBO9402532.1 hypothetical protein [Shimia sp. R9_3]